MSQVEAATPSSDTSKGKYFLPHQGSLVGQKQWGENLGEPRGKGGGGGEGAEEGEKDCMCVECTGVWRFKDNLGGLLFRRHPSWFFEMEILSGLELTK